MGLRQTMQGAVSSTFKAIGDLAESVTYLHRTANTYDPTTGTVTGTDSSTTVQCVFASFDLREIGGDVQPTDMKCLIPAAALSFDPKLMDRITRADGSKWEVVKVKRDPAQALWTLQVRVSV